MGIWTGKEQASFQAIIDSFRKKYPDVSVKYTSAGDNLPTVLSTAVEGGNPPDLAEVAQPGLIQGFVQKGALKPMTFAKGTVVQNFGKAIADVGTVNGKLYGLLFKAANKSTVWYSTADFKNAGVTPPKTWPAFTKAATTVKQSGVTPYSIGGADGWTLTDLFENIYIRSAGLSKYNMLAKHQIKWTDPSVTKALAMMATVVGTSGNMVGGTSGALQTDFPTSVSNVLSKNPKAAMVIEGDFVPGVVKTSLKPVQDYDVFPFPSIGASPASVVGGGDIFVMFKDNEAIRAFVNYLTTPQAAAIWAKRGGFSSPNKKLSPSVYPDPILRKTAGAIGQAKAFAFDLSDLQPASFGATAGRGLWKQFQDFLQSPARPSRSRSRWRPLPRRRTRSRGTMSAGSASAVPPLEPAAADSGPRGGRSGCASSRWLRCSSRRRRSSSDSGSSTRRFRPRAGASTTRAGTDFVWFDNYKRLFTSDILLTSIKNNALWVLVVPAAVTAIGLVFAVLVERVRFSVAFRTAIFMPMAISAFAAGVTWRIMYVKDPDLGAVNAATKSVHDVFVTPGALTAAAPSTSGLQGSEQRGFVSDQDVKPGDTVSLGLTAIPVADLPSDAQQAAKPEPLQGGITGVVWRDFKPGGGGKPGVSTKARSASRASRSTSANRTGRSSTPPAVRRTAHSSSRTSVPAAIGWRSRPRRSRRRSPVSRGSGRS